ncbi:hypothetical protein HanRHA438_Chr12g0551511 [Helianthus annuus]|uniref:Uncharacterized protein n=1 Tax=Helianthus annuus TaxID=4232 RepID=A0A251T4Z1_HELAN|nr:hypothetical protein HanXRQr2_Chr12g0540721 [Helianthus annuus]KAJ0489334.1 hypothetical protein HanHA300_Chr12g0442861 [Helianthus annuus]KAJ0493119.1 hypothetical protein HanIR_Chr12g0582511 [Helianthus annuus]KAJ0505214.1 hypothetical protein HanHA89_Chr12g0467981 [Helianthus annuus]KAJ0674896.1 hypothetical protein HanLR1_Chr12g0445081 [Helianthus annuus]
MVGGDMDSLEKMVVGVDLDPDRDSDSEMFELRCSQHVLLVPSTNSRSTHYIVFYKTTTITSRHMLMSRSTSCN